MTRLPNPPNNNAAFTCELPLGLPAGRGRERVVELRAFDGETQLRLLDLNPGQPRERLLSQALAIIVKRLGSLPDPPPEIIHQLTFADRHAIIRSFLLARGTRELSTAAECKGCARRLELTLDLAAVRLPSVPRSGVVRLSQEFAGRPTRRRLRLPGPADLEQAGDEMELLANCLGCAPETARTWIATAEIALSRYDPLGHISIVGRCPDCAGNVEAELDLAQSWLTSVKRASGNLLEEIHFLASRYHWTEGEVLRLPNSRRQMYLDLCEAASSRPLEFD